MQTAKALPHMQECSTTTRAGAKCSICGQYAVSFFVNSSTQHRGNEAEPDSNGNKNFQSGPNVPCQSAQTDKYSELCITQTAKVLPHARVLNCYKSRSEILNLRTELFRPLWTRQRSTEEMRPNLIAMEIKISNQARTYLARVLKLTSQ